MLETFSIIYSYNFLQIGTKLALRQLVVSDKLLQKQLLL